MATAPEPFNLQLMDVDDFVEKNHLMEVTSSFIHIPSSSTYDPEGIFSETIFGATATQARLIKMGYIKLNCHVFHPVIYQNLQTLKRFYTEIMSGRAYAKWDPIEKDFVRASEDEDGASTGYSFFLKYFDQIQFSKNESFKRNDKVSIMLKYKDQLLIDKCIVCPAGIRDIKDEDGRIEKDSINSLYISLLERAKAMPRGADKDPIYDAVHYSIQRKVLEVYEYLLEFMRGKRGFFEAKLGARAVAQGTRNVITSTSLECSDPKSPQFHKLDEVKVPLYQAAKGFAPLVTYYLKTMYYSTIIQDGADQIPLINLDNYQMEYVQISDKDRDAMLNTEGIMKTLDRFRDPEYRWRPAGATANGKLYALYLVYDADDEIYIFRNLEEFKVLYSNAKNKEVQVDKVRPLTYAEMVYIATYYASRGKSGTITRYPITDENSIFVAKTHLISTAPGRIVKLMTNISAGTFEQLPEYPTYGKNFIDALMFHPSRRAGLGADFDGNCLTGSTTVQIRYAPIWYSIIEDLDYSVSGQDVSRMLNALKRDTYVYRNDCLETVYTTVRMDELPQPGPFSLDKNGAKVYDLPPGCEVLTIENGMPTWRSFDKITVEENCEYRTIKVGGRTAEVSTNPSVAVFDIESGNLKKVTPVEAEGKFAPTIIKDISPYGKTGTYMDGWFLGTSISSLTKNIFMRHLTNGSRDFLVGLFAGLMDGDGVITNDNDGRISFKFAAVNKTLVESIKILAYKLGIRYEVSTISPSNTSNWSKESYVVLFNSGDSVGIRDELVCFSPENVEKLNYWKTLDVYVNRDNIPLSKAELKEIQGVVAAHGSKDDLEYFKRQNINDGYRRSMFHKYFSFIKNPNVLSRIKHWTVHWDKVKLIDEPSHATVYDILVPSSKVFAVNNGLIVYDTVSWIPIFSDEANDECDKYYHSPSFYVTASGSSEIGTDDLIDLCLYANTMDTPDLAKK